MSGDRFHLGDRPFRADKPFRVEELPYVETEKLADVERAAIERAVIERETVIQTLQTDVLEIQSERDALQSQLTQVQTERDELRDRIRQLEIERPNLEPQTVFSTLGSAVGDVRAELGESSYDIGDVEFALKANVVQTEEGLRMHLPSLDETFASENLSEITFRVRPGAREPAAPESEYAEVPDVVGRQQDDAERELARAGLSVGDVATVDDPEAEPGTVVDQFPDPYTLASPDAPVDLTVVSERERLREEFERAIERAELDPESGLAHRLREAGIDDLEAVAELDPERLAAITALPEQTVGSLHEELVERVGEVPARRLEEIDGIGPTYAARLREAGVESIAALATLAPDDVAAVTGASESRAETWVEQARLLTED